MTNLEFNLLIYLVSQPDRVFTYQQIYEAVWGEPYAYEKNNIMTHISHLRAKIEPDLTHPRYIDNVRGVGYDCYGIKTERAFKSNHYNSGIDTPGFVIS